MMRKWAILVIFAGSLPVFGSIAQEPSRAVNTPIQSLRGKWVGTCALNGKTDLYRLNFDAPLIPATKIGNRSIHTEYDDAGKHLVFDGTWSADYKLLSGQLRYHAQVAQCELNITPNTEVFCITNPSVTPEIIALSPDLEGRGKFTLDAGKQAIRPGDPTGSLMWSHQDFDPNNPPDWVVSPATRYICAGN